MKKSLFFAALSALLLSAAVVFTPTCGHAQTVTALAHSGSDDTVTDAATTYFTSRIYGNGTVALQLNIKKVSGTVGGYAVVQGSIDGNYAPSTWVNISTDSLTLTDGDNAKIWVLPADYLHYRIKLVTSGTQVLTGKGYYYIKPNFPPNR